MNKSIRERATEMAKRRGVREAFEDGPEELRAALDIRTGGELDTVQLDIMCDVVSSTMKKEAALSGGMADHPWEPGAFGTCRRCGTNPDTPFSRTQHPSR